MEVPPLTLFSLESGRAGEGSDAVRARVVVARAFRAAREMAGRAGESVRGPRFHDRGLAPFALEAVAGLDRDSRSLLRQALVKEGLSGRAYTRVLALARTIADLDQAVAVRHEHVAEALSLRLDYRRVGLS